MVGMVSLEFYASRPVCDIVSPEVTKNNMVKRVCASYGMPLEKIVYIGDSISDIGGMELAEYCACPQNASADVKEYVTANNGYIAKKKTTLGCLEIFSKFVKPLNLFAIISDVDGCLYIREEEDSYEKKDGKGCELHK